MTLPNTAGADAVKLYLRGSPASAEYLLDQVELVLLDPTVTTTTSGPDARPNILFIRYSQNLLGAVVTMRIMKQ